MTRKERIDRVLHYHDSIEKAWEETRKDGTEIDFIRHMATTDVYFLLYYILGRTDLCYEEWYENETLDIEGVSVPTDLALYTNDEKGLEFYEKISKDAHKVLNHEGHIAFEIGLGQSEEVKNILEKNNFENIEIEKDLAGIDRVISAQLI